MAFKTRKLREYERIMWHLRIQLWIAFAIAFAGCVPLVVWVVSA